jgi:FixJ family two-component response regulator
MFVMSGLDDPQVTQRVLQSGAVGVIEKPFDIAVVRKMVKERTRSLSPSPQSLDGP